MSLINTKTSFKSGYVSLIGRPNTGKSTLLNTIVGKKISIVTPKPQTTRNKILGVWHGDNAQIIFLDTPGIHKSNKKLNQRMLRTAFSALTDSDIILIMVDAKAAPLHDKELLQHLPSERIPVFLLINKIDLIPKLGILGLIGIYKGFFPFREIIPLSALTGENCDDLTETIIKYLPEGLPYFPREMITDQPESFTVAELVREKLIMFTHQEIPFACAVVIEDLSTDKISGCPRITATIIVEKDSQKGIIIGEKGQRLKHIGEKARGEIESLLGRHVYIKLWVKVAKNWRNKEAILNRIGC